MRTRIKALTIWFAAAVAAVGLLSPLARATAPIEIVYAISRGDQQVGQLLLSISQNEDFVEARIRSDVVVDYQLVEAYRFEHEAREIWHDGQLVGFTSHTVDNGRSYSVVLEDAGDSLLLMAGGEAVQVPADITPSSAWSLSMVQRSAYFDSFTGQLLQVRIDDLGEEMVALSGHGVPARHLRMVGDAERDMWFVNGTLVRLVATAPDGSKLRFELIPNS